MDTVVTEARVNVERTVSLDEAADRATRALRGLGLRPELVEVSGGDTSTAWRCRLIDDNGVMPPGAKGGGKGGPDEARVGALFEALEHYLTGPTFFAPDLVRVLPARQVAPNLAHGASTALLARAPDDTLACWRYTALRGDQDIDVPVYESAPWYVEDSGRPLRELVGDEFDYRAVGRYSTNSGSAIGITETEAIVHSVNEIIERDAVSLLLVRSFFAKNHRVRLVDRKTLPADLTNLLTAVEQRIEATVYLLEITTELGVPSMFAYVPPTPSRPHLRGAGASLNPWYAAHRALSELLQFFVFQEYTRPGNDPFGHLEVLRKYPGLYRCGRFDLTAHLGQAEVVAFTDRPFPADLTGHLDQLLDTLVEHGFTPYLRRVHTLPGEVSAVHVYVPGMEHFGTVTQGIPMLPGPRARRARRMA